MNAAATVPVYLPDPIWASEGASDIGGNLSLGYILRRFYLPTNSSPYHYCNVVFLVAAISEFWGLLLLHMGGVRRGPSVRLRWLEFRHREVLFTLLDTSASNIYNCQGNQIKSSYYGAVELDSHKYSHSVEATPVSFHAHKACIRITCTRTLTPNSTSGGLHEGRREKDIDHWWQNHNSLSNFAFL